MSLDEPKFLTLAEVLYLHDESLARYGGSAGVREPGLIESALGSARNAFLYGHGGLFEIAAAISFLRKNDVDYPQDDGSLCRAMIEIAKKRLDKSGLAAVLKQQAKVN